MYIKQLEITNFQKHSHLILNFTNKLNILYGESDAGKSCILRAIKWIFFNEPKGDIVRKEKTKKTSVKVILDNDNVIEKIKSNKINAYILKEKGKEERKFDSIGKEIPEEVKKVLGVSTIKIDDKEIILNISNQLSLPFLIGESATFRSKLFNKLTGNNLIDKALQSLNKDILKTGRETKTETQYLKQQQDSLKEVTKQKKQLENTYNNFKEKFNNLKLLQERYDRLNKIFSKLNDNNISLKNIKYKLNELKIVPQDSVIGLKESIIKLEKYNILINKRTTIIKGLEKTKTILKSINIPKINTDNLKNDCKKLKKLKDLYSQLIRIKDNVKSLNSEIYNYKNFIVKNEKKYKELLKQIKICPFFKKPCPLNKEK
jgi:exonuclease SbcC